MSSADEEQVSDDHSDAEDSEDDLSDDADDDQSSNNDYTETEERKVIDAPSSSLSCNKSWRNFLNIANWKLGGQCYHSKHKPGFIVFIPYRFSASTASMCQSYESFPTDPDLITNFLSRVSEKDLNRINEESGESLLHIAVKYDRAGKTCHHSNTGTDDHCTSKLVHENIVKWLLNNSKFSRRNVHARDKRGYTAFHTALNANMPQNLHLEFYSENHGGAFGRFFVAQAALRTLLEDHFCCQGSLNIPNNEDLTPLAFVMTKSVARIDKQNYIQFKLNDGTTYRFSEGRDCSIQDFIEDYLFAIKMILKSPYLRLHGMFGVSDVGRLPFIRPRFGKLASLKPSRDLLALRQFCSGDVYHNRLGYNIYCDSGTIKGQDVPGHAPLLQSLLSNKAGNVNDGVKAQVLITTFLPLSRLHTDEYCWAFDPTTFCDKNIREVLRKFYLKHATECIQAVTVLQDELIREACHLLLLPHQEWMMKTKNINVDCWKIILKFADWHRFVSVEWQRLESMSNVLGSSVAIFFLGDIEECFSQIYNLPKDCWNKVLECAGWKRHFPQLDVFIPKLPMLPLSQKKKRRRN